MINGHGDDAWLYDGKIRSNFSSNVYSHTDMSGLKRHLAAHLDSISLYPHPEAGSLQAALAEKSGLERTEVCVTNGATEAIYLIAQAFRASRSAILIPSFSEYADACRMHGHRITLARTLHSLPGKAELVWLCNPNNPTGKVYEKERLTAFIRQYPHVLYVIDQSYEHFTRKPLFTASEAVTFPNVLLLHSMTKQFAVPGLRLGYITAAEALLNRVRAQRMPWSVNGPAIEAGHYLLANPSPIDICACLSEKERFVRRLQELEMLDVRPSDTHFMLIRLRQGKAAALKAYLALEHGMLIRDASNFEGLDDTFIRVAAQTSSENDALAEAIRKWWTLYPVSQFSGQ
jgi:threonine-phosphate decarboxylase